jgi:hypothetical protein
MDRFTSVDLRALGSRLLDTPSSKALRQIEHAIALYVLYRAGKAVVTLGPSGIKKAVTGLVLKGEGLFLFAGGDGAWTASASYTCVPGAACTPALSTPMQVCI